MCLIDARSCFKEISIYEQMKNNPFRFSGYSIIDKGISSGIHFQIDVIGIMEISININKSLFAYKEHVSFSTLFFKMEFESTFWTVEVNVVSHIHVPWSKFKTTRVYTSKWRHSNLLWGHVKYSKPKHWSNWTIRFSPHKHFSRLPLTYYNWQRKWAFIIIVVELFVFCCIDGINFCFSV